MGEVSNLVHILGKSYLTDNEIPAKGTWSESRFRIFKFLNSFFCKFGMGRETRNFKFGIRIYLGKSHDDDDDDDDDDDLADDKMPSNGA